MKIRNKKYNFPRLRDLPRKEQEPFKKWLNGQTCPLVDEKNIPMSEQDFYYSWDYERWKMRLPIVD